jgi:hypothetical protein
MSQASSDSETGMPEQDADGRGKATGSQDALRRNAIKPGEARNPAGTNAWRKAQARIARFMRDVDPEREGTRFDNLLQVAYVSALIPGLKGAPDRKALIEQCAGKAKQQVDLSNSDRTLGLRVLAVLPDNGRGPDDAEPDDGEPSTSTKG